MSLVFKEKENSTAMRELIWANEGVYKDDYGGELEIPDSNEILAILIIDQEKFFQQQSDMDLANKQAMQKHAIRLQSDPKLKFLQGQQGFRSPLAT